MTLMSEDGEIALLYKLHEVDEGGHEQVRRTLENL